MRLELLPAVRSLTRLGDHIAVGSEVLQRADSRIEGDHRRLALLADQQRRDQAADLLDLRQNALHVRIGLQADHQRNRLVRHVHVDVLFLAVVEQVELVAAAGRPRSCRRGRRPARAPAPHRRRRGMIGVQVGAGVLRWLLRLLRCQQARTEA